MDSYRRLLLVSYLCLYIYSLPLILPILAQTTEVFGVEGVDVDRSAVLGQMTTSFPVSPLIASTFLLTGLSGVEIGTHQKETIPYAFAVTLLMLVVSIISGGINIQIN